MNQLSPPKITFLSLSLFVISAVAPALQNFTVLLPPGTTNHGNPELLCTPPGWTDIATFYVGNYLTHALTVVHMPGEETPSWIINALASLLFPPFGLYRGLRAIWTKAVFAKGDLQKAARSGALCMVVRSSSWRPIRDTKVSNAILLSPEDQAPVLEGNKVESGTIRPHREDDEPNSSHEDTEGLLASDTAQETIQLSDFPLKTDDPVLKRVHVCVFAAPWSYCRYEGPESADSRTVRASPVLPEGYKLVIVPPDTPIRPLNVDNADNIISCSHDWITGLIAVGQAIFAIVTLWQSRGDQVQRYGYAAFGLTVAPYATMSFVNLLGTLMRPDFDAVYLVGSPTMLEARSRLKGSAEGYFPGTVAELEVDETFNFQSHNVKPRLQFMKRPLEFKASNRILEVHSPELNVLYGSTVQGADDSKVTATSQTTELSHNASAIVLQQRKEWPGYTTNPEQPLLLIPSCDPFRYHQRHQTLYTLPLPHWKDPQRGWDINWTLDGYNSLLPYSSSFVERARWYGFLLGMVPLAIIGGISRFRGGSSSATQRALTMLWVSWGIAVGFVRAEATRNDVIELSGARGKMKKGLVLGLELLLLLPIGAPAVAGFVVVGLMLREFGVCVVLPS
ncbi:uncharacterized protein BDZ99DRAFT_454978 [Mytilinidion resinicola]|uniref:Uncharacterized protein n=1 Tax=Mytilinidion resinicola TaxID=574789 RepID=A0A6A6Y139_9PEZI|nr:uncharacterized protein BDZ99DRAFT_454978 [Mytilinidion resinicola]KAF2802233.1 hypothetical protein BDZ99DRAFT_454978 [Mytilinidion resinicola]